MRIHTIKSPFVGAFRMGRSIVRFRRDSTGRVTALSLSLGRVYDMRFQRVETK